MGFEKIGVVGCGLMGAGIVEACATAGFSVVAIKATKGSPGEARERLTASLNRRTEKGKLSSEDRDRILERVRFTSEVAELDGVDLVVESTIEELEAKGHILCEVE